MNLYPRVVAAKHLAASNTLAVDIPVLADVTQMTLTIKYRAHFLEILYANFVQGSPQVCLAMHSARTNVKSLSAVQPLVAIQWRQSVVYGKRTTSKQYAHCANPYVVSI
eukprot:PhF_6_TR10532/c1_g1_i15/m.16600